jgi:hypothetical protein
MRWGCLQLVRPQAAVQQSSQRAQSSWGLRFQQQRLASCGQQQAAEMLRSCSSTGPQAFPVLQHSLGHVQCLLLLLLRGLMQKQPAKASHKQQPGQLGGSVLRLALQVAAVLAAAKLASSRNRSSNSSSTWVRQVVTSSVPY